MEDNVAEARKEILDLYNYCFGSQGISQADQRLEALLQKLPKEYVLLFSVGGFFYFENSHPRSLGDTGPLRLVGISALCPHNTLDIPSEDKPLVYMGQSIFIPETVWKKVIGEGSPSLFDSRPGTNAKVDIQLHDLSVPFFMERGFKQFAWFSQTHPLIIELRKHYSNQDLAPYGGFGYFSHTRDETDKLKIDCLVPVARDREEWLKLLRNQIPICVEEDRAVPFKAYISDQCQICFQGTVADLVLFTPCNHACLCANCSNQQKSRNGSSCPLCRQSITETTPLPKDSFQFKAVTELPGFTLHFGTISLTDAENQNLLVVLNGLLKDPTYCSKKSSHPPQALQNLLNLQSSQRYAFVRPYFGIPLDRTFGKIRDVNTFIDNCSLDIRPLIQGLLYYGGFVTFDRSDNPINIYPIYTPPEGTQRFKKLTLKTSSVSFLPLFQAEVKKMQDVNTTNFDASRITVASLMKYARFFRWNPDRQYFEYLRTSDSEGAWTATFS